MTLRFLQLNIVLLAGVCGPVTAQDNAVSKPNIVFILADDVGREVLECYGGESCRTPRLNELAEGGMRFLHCYSMPVCHPTRVCLLTGRYPRHLGHPGWGSFPEEAEQQTFAHILKEAGYATAVSGKWQLALLGRDPLHPRRLGFDEWSLFGWHEGPRYHEPMIHQNGRLREDTAGTYGPDLYVEFLVDFMRRNRQQPFLAFYSMALCHDVTDDLSEPVPYGEHGRYDNYREMVAKMDERVGRLIDAVNHLGLSQRTLILFTADNGTPTRSIIRAEDGRYVREPVVLRLNGQSIPGGKGELTDWGTRVPAIASWRGVIEAGRVDDSLIDFSDILPTFADLAGEQPLAGDRLDGHSFADLLRGSGPGRRTWVCAEGRNGQFFVKTRNWKLYSDGRFFNTEKDPFENSPVSAVDVPPAERTCLERGLESLKER